MTDHFLSSEIDNTSPLQAKFHIIPMPLEKTVSYGAGTGQGPLAILSASSQLELWNKGTTPADMGIHTHDPIDCSGDIHTSLVNLSDTIESVLIDGKAVPIVLGGEHTLTYGAIEALYNTGYDCESFFILQIDAHADLRHRYEGNLFSHATVMRRVTEDSEVNLVQVGVRALCEEEVEVGMENDNIHPFTPFKFGWDYDSLINKVLDKDFLASLPDKVYITIDVDGFDPSVFPTTGTPVPGGLSWGNAMRLLEGLIEVKKVIGFDINEFAPNPVLPGYDMAAAQLVYDIMGMIQRSSQNKT